MIEIGHASRREHLTRGESQMMHYTEERITTREAETPELISSYFARIDKGSLLTHAQEVDLSRRARAGDAKARTRLVEKNLRLVVSVAKKYRGYGDRRGSDQPTRFPKARRRYRLHRLTRRLRFRRRRIEGPTRSRQREQPGSLAGQAGPSSVGRDGRDRPSYAGARLRA